MVNIDVDQITQDEKQLDISVKRSTCIYQYQYQGIAWDAAASVVNQHKKTGRFMVPKKVLEARSRRGMIESVVLFQEAWCGPKVGDGNNLDDICESMCPLYHGGSEALYEIRYDGNKIRASKIEDVQRVLKYVNL
ncbi:unnamed protein product [Angiostrongylus costaricensis]|uniref:Astacin domain-containing protein n=1 Tax=Angiostrongylus costaricensis TaxID=334426 RepID=A0A0R3Q269_ANGCS|nr:unnamed protein product [Angiostrongylus costaricensis]